MGPPIEALARAMRERRMRIAVFDAGLRERTGQWQLAQSIPIEQALEHFRSHDRFVDDNGHVRVPLHESDSPALSNEYLAIDPSGEHVLFYDPGFTSLHRLPIEECAACYPAWRLRFWTDAYTMTESPPFVHAVAAPESPSESTASAVAGMGQPGHVDTIFEDARSALVSRRDSLRQDAREVFASLSSDEFVSERGGIQDLRAGGRSVDDFGQQVIELQIPPGHQLAGEDPDHISAVTGVRAGDEVVVEAPDHAALPVEAELFDIAGGRVELGIYWDSARGSNAEAAFDPNSDAAFLIGKLVDGREFDAITRALDTVAHHDETRSLYAGTSELSFDEAQPDIGRAELNQSQAKAVTRAIGSRDVVCIEAPPSTGARRVIRELTRHEADQDRRVALLAPDAAAVSTLLERRSTRDGSVSLETALADAGIELSRISDREDPADTASVVASRLSDADRLDDHGFDLAIVDQAARVPVPAGAIPFAKASRVVLVGDPMQSPMSAIDRRVTPTLAPSIYEHVTSAYGAGCVARLRCQYRMNQAIALFPNRHFYDGRLIHGGENRTWTIDTLAPLEATHVDGRERETPTASYLNEAEVQATLEEVRQLLDRGVAPTDIGILTPYSAQMGKIRVALNEEVAGLGDQILIGPVTQFRCVHRDALIISTVRTAPPSEWAIDTTEPFWTDRGVNVALTRAQKRLVILGDWEIIQARSDSVAADDPFGELAEFLESRGLLDRTSH